MNNITSDTQDVKIEAEVHNEQNVHEQIIGNTAFKVVSYYRSENDGGRTYEDIVKSALLREIGRNY